MGAYVAGVGATALILLDPLTRPMLVLALVQYLSLWSALPVFGGIQSDALLVEVGFLAISLTGNYHLLNLLTMFVCLFLLDDRPFAKAMPRWSIPHQPRLNWELWLAASESPAQDPWVVDFLHKLLEGSPPALELLANNPFPDHPPTYVRAMLYRYCFTTAKERAATGDCWARKLLFTYIPPLRLDDWAAQ